MSDHFDQHIIQDATAKYKTAKSIDIKSVIKRYIRNYDVPESLAIEHGEELKKFLALAAVNSNEQLGMAGQVDELWHEFLIHTQDYASFCKKVGGTFLHHNPYGSPKKVTEDENYKRFFNMYTAVFSKKPPKHIWPQLDGTAIEGGECGGSCGGGCNSGNCWS